MLICGDLGFIGSHLKKAIDFPFVGYDLKEGKDITKINELKRYIKKHKPKTIINLAALAGVKQGERYPNAYINTNIKGVLNLCKVCKKEKIKLIHYSSSSVYGDSEQGQYLTEETKTNPRSIYGMTKVAGETIIKNFGIDYIIIRPFTVVGCNGRKNMVVYKWLEEYKSGQPITFYGDGNTYRGYTWVDDLVRGTLYTMKLKNKTYNLGGDKPISLNEMWRIFISIFPNAIRRKMKLPYYDQPFSLADTTKAKIELGWESSDVAKVIKKIWQAEADKI